MSSKNYTLEIGIYRVDKSLPMPKKAYPDDSGFDLYSKEDVTIPARGFQLISCGVIMVLPSAVECQIRGRSGLARKGILAHFGTIDSQFRGELGPILFNMTNEPYKVCKGDRVCQAVINIKLDTLTPVCEIELVEVNSFEATTRGSQGFGSSGK